MKNLPNEIQSFIMGYPRQLGAQAILVDIKSSFDRGDFLQAKMEWLRIPGNWNLLVDAVHEYTSARLPEAFWGPAMSPSNSTRFAEFLDNLSDDEYERFENMIMREVQIYE